MPQPIVNDLDYLAACLHGRRSRLAEGERLKAVCGLPDVSELGSAVYPEAEFHSAADFQRRLARDLVRELTGFLKHLEGAGADLLAWLLVRFQAENIKVLLRDLLHRTPLETPEEYLLSLPPHLALNMPALTAAESLEEFTERLPSGALRKSLREALGLYADEPRSFFLEGALDRGYFEELLARAERIAGEERDWIQPIVLQEAEAFQLMLAVRGRFHYRIAPPMLSPLRIRRSRISSERFAAMLAAPDILAAATLAVGHALDVLPSGRGAGNSAVPVTSSNLETLAWRRFLRLSNRAFRRSHVGLGVVIGYVGVRRVEVANLTTLSEGLRSGAAAKSLRSRLFPGAEFDAVYA